MVHSRQYEELGTDWNWDNYKSQRFSIYQLESSSCFKIHLKILYFLRETIKLQMQAIDRCGIYMRTSKLLLS